MRIFREIPRLLMMLWVCVAASGCAYIIPEDQNAPRNNTVLGERRKPQMNTPIPVPQSKHAPQSFNAQEDEQVISADLPPVAQVASGSAATVETRRMPVENRSFQLAGSEFPDLQTVPPRPPASGDNSAGARLNATRVLLERDRTRALDSKKSLAADAAAEPSLLSPGSTQTDGVVPPVDPVIVAPAPAVKQTGRPEVFVTPHAAGAKQPVILRPPVAATPLLAAPRLAAENMLRVTTSDFNPLLAAGNGDAKTASLVGHTSSGGYGYIAPSRYAARR